MVEWAVPEYSKSAVRRAGKALASDTGDGIPEAEMDIIRNWRASHSYVLTNAANRSRNRLKRLGVDAELAQRLKRMDSIESKLRDGRAKDLSTMQDIAGCRLIVNSVDDLRRVKRSFESSRLLSHEPDKFDYVWVRPKTNGYRSLHYVEGHGSKKVEYQEMKVETQIRTRKMHYWATAVETVDTFFDEKLKAGHGDATWAHFFQLASCVLADSEDLPSAAGSPSGDQLRNELGEVNEKLDAINMMEACKTIVTDDDSGEGRAFVLQQYQESHRGSVNRAVSVFSFDDLQKGLDFYSEAEKDPKVNAVLVQVDDRNALRSAYPNYFTDTSEFLTILQEFMSAA